MNATVNIRNVEVILTDNNNWKDKKIQNEYFSDSYLRLSKKLENVTLNNMSFNLRNCTSFIDFRILADGSKKLALANFCRARLCPMCNWRKSKKIFGQVLKVINAINDIESYEYIFLTLTCKNVPSNLLKSQIDEILKSFMNLMRISKVKRITQGYFRSLEVTYNKKDDTYHPHIHCIIAVNKNYFTSRDYIKQSDWVFLWQKCLKVDYLPVVDIRKFISSSDKSIAEVSKYTVKSSDILHFNSDGTINEKLTDKLVYALHFSLKSKRLIGMGGLFKEYHSKLNLEDLNSDNIDLIDTDNDNIENNITELIVRYKWNVGLRNYYLEKE